MKRRDFSLSAAAAVALASAGGMAHAQAFTAGKNYNVIDKRVAVDTPRGKIEVTEFFWYNCPHCNAFEPAFEAWVKAAPKDVVVKRVPVKFQSSFVPQQKLYYALEAMGKVDELHVKVFNAIHQEKKQLGTDEQIAAWVATQGVDPVKFKEAYNSFSVNAKVRKAAQLQEDYHVEGVPSFGIAGRFYTDGSMAGSMENALKAVEFLIGEARKG